MLNTEHLERERKEPAEYFTTLDHLPYYSICSSTDKCKLTTLSNTNRYLAHLVHLTLHVFRKTDLN